MPFPKNSRPLVFGHIQYALLCAIKGLEVFYEGNYYPTSPMILELILMPVSVDTTLSGWLISPFVILLFAIMGGDYKDLK